MPAIRRCIQGAAERDWRSILAVRQYGARTPLVYDEGNGRRSKQAAILLFSNIVNNNAQKQGRGGVPPADRELSPIYPVDTVTTLSGRDKDKRPSFSLGRGGSVVRVSPHWAPIRRTSRREAV